MSIILTIVFYVFGEKLLLIFGASENTITYATDYLNTYVLGTIFVMLSLSLNAFITAQGFSKISMTNVAIGAIANIILDPIFIFGTKNIPSMGIEGAAIATIIGQFFSFFVGLVLNIFFNKDSFFFW